MTTENWDLRAFIFGCDDLDDEEKRLCYDALNREGFSAANKRRAFLALDEADLRSLGVTILSTRKVLLLEIAGAGAGALPAPRRLMDGAAKLLPLLSDGNGIMWKLTYSDNLVITYVDAWNVVDRIRVWAELACKAAVHQRWEKNPSPLLVSGLVKTGKSYTLEHVVPAVVAEALREQAKQRAEQQAEQQTEEGDVGDVPLAGMVVLRLKGDVLDRSGGATDMLWNLLGVLLQWARREHVPMQAGALADAKEALAQAGQGSPSMPGSAVLAFLEAVEVPVLVLCDEVQSLFLPTIDGSKLDVRGAAYIRDTFMKYLLVYGPRTVLWCLTGSSMAQTWINLADMPPNGHTVITSAFAAHLPATYSAAHMQWAWQQLQQDSGSAVPLDRRLLELCPQSVALLTTLVRTWVDYGRPSDLPAFVQGYMRSKLIEESRREWKLGLGAMPLSQRLTILDLAFPAVGAWISEELHSGLRLFLSPHLVRKTADSRYYLRDPHQRLIVRLLINKDGTLRDSWSDLEFSATLTQLDGGWNLFYLGEAADYLLGPKASRRWQHEKPPAGMDELKAKLQAIADDVTNKLLAAAAAAGGEQQRQQPGGGASGAALVVDSLGRQELWERQPWLQQVLNSKWNDRDREAYMKNKQARCTDLDMLVFYLRLSRNVLAHTKPWDREAGATVDVGVIEALPDVLGQSLFVFNEVMVDALQLLSCPTVEAAAVEFAAEVSGGGGGGGSLECSGEDDSSSGSGLSSGTVGSSGGGLSSGTGGAGSTSSGGWRGSTSGGGGRGRGARAMPDQCRPSRPGLAAADVGQRPPLVYTTSGGRGGWGKGEPRAPALAPRLRVRLPLFAPAASAAAAAVGPRLPC